MPFLQCRAKIKKLQKESAKYLTIKANLLKRAGRTDEAIVTVKQLSLVSNNKAEHVLLLADLYYENSETEKAIAVLRKASFENQEDKTLKLKLATFYQYLKNYNDTRRLLWSLVESTEDITEKIS